MTSGRPHIAWTDAQLKRMRAIVESGDLTLADIGRRFRCSEHEVRRQTVAGGWANPNAEKVKPKVNGIVSRPATIFHDTNDARRPAIPIHAARQCIASKAHAYGVAVGSGATFRDLPARDLMNAIGKAWDRTQGNEKELSRVEIIIRAMAARLQHEGPVVISPQNLGLLNSFAGITTPGGRKRRAA